METWDLKWNSMDENEKKVPGSNNQKATTKREIFFKGEYKSMNVLEKWKCVKILEIIYNFGVPSGNSDALVLRNNPRQTVHNVFESELWNSKNRRTSTECKKGGFTHTFE